MIDVISAFGFVVLGYLSGSLSFALWVTRIAKGVDVREAGSHHATTTNTVRQVGWGAGVIVFVLDIAKGFIPTFLAVRYSPYEWAIPLVAMAAVIGHCWPVFAGFSGGMGLATAGGAILAVYQMGMLIALGILIALALTIRHAARAGLITGLLLAPTFWIFGERGVVIWLAFATGVIISVRFSRDWNREYSELWLDRDKST